MSYTPYNTRSNQAKAAIRNLEPFYNSTKNFRGESHTPGSWTEIERLYDWKNSVVDSDYIVYSYATPIAWHVPERKGYSDFWIIPQTRYSNTSSHHQSVVRQALASPGYLEVG